MLAKMIMISALVCSSQPISEASPRSQPSTRPARWVPSSLPPTEAASRTPATQEHGCAAHGPLVRSPVLRKNTGITSSST
jgi:hypothetical protein